MKGYIVVSLGTDGKRAIYEISINEDIAREIQLDTADDLDSKEVWIEKVELGNLQGKRLTEYDIS